MEALRAGSGGRFDLPTGTVYPALHRLERAGLVLAAGLAGPRPVRAAIVAEVADGLTETTAAHQRSGLAPAAAAGAAVAEFGGARLIAAGFGPELAAETGRRIGLGLLATGPLVGSAWLGSCRSVQRRCPPRPAWRRCSVLPETCCCWPAWRRRLVGWPGRSRSWPRPPAPPGSPWLAGTCCHDGSPVAGVATARTLPRIV
jgi:hypothetical protein